MLFRSRLLSCQSQVDSFKIRKGNLSSDDIGKLMLANNLPEPFQRTLDLTQAKEIRFIEAEQEVFGANHAGVGAYLLGFWGLPTTIVEAVAFHHQPGRSEAATLSPLTAVHVANVFEHDVVVRGRHQTPFGV